MEFLSDFMPIVLYFLGGVLLITLIIFVLKITVTMDKVNALLDDVLVKSSKLDGLFDSIEDVGNTISKVNRSVFSFATGFIGKLIHKKKKKVEDDYYE